MQPGNAMKLPASLRVALLAALLGVVVAGGNLVGTGACCASRSRHRAQCHRTALSVCTVHTALQLLGSTRQPCAESLNVISHCR